MDLRSTRGPWRLIIQVDITDTKYFSHIVYIERLVWGKSEIRPEQFGLLEGKEPIQRE